MGAATAPGAAHIPFDSAHGLQGLPIVQCRVAGASPRSRRKATPPVPRGRPAQEGLSPAENGNGERFWPQKSSLPALGAFDARTCTSARWLLTARSRSTSICPRSLTAEHPGGNDAGIVKHEEVARAKQAQQGRHLAVLEGAAPPGGVASGFGRAPWGDAERSAPAAEHSQNRKFSWRAPTDLRARGRGVLLIRTDQGNTAEPFGGVAIGGHLSRKIVQQEAIERLPQIDAHESAAKLRKP